MATTESSAIAHPSTRGQRGLVLYREHAAEIRFDAQERVWLVPSQSEGTSVYEVTIGRRGESCECADFENRGGVVSTCTRPSSPAPRARRAPGTARGTRAASWSRSAPRWSRSASASRRASGTAPPAPATSASPKRIRPCELHERGRRQSGPMSASLKRFRRGGA